MISDCGDPARGLQDLARVVREDGVVGFSVRNRDGPQQHGHRREVLREGGPGFDWWFFSLESVAKLCSQCGLACQRVYPVFMEPPTEDIEGAVRRHLEAVETNSWRANAWEMFVVAEPVTRADEGA